jgi:hypothetical protein
MKCKQLVKEAGITWLYEACGEVQSKTQRTYKRRRTSETAGSFEIHVDEVNMVGYVGSNHQNAIWEEWGTGDKAIDDNGNPSGKGRKGGWWIKVGYGKDEITPKVAESYKWVSERRDKDGNLTFVFTKGKKGTLSFTKAYNSLKGKLENRAKEILKDKMVD